MKKQTDPARITIAALTEICKPAVSEYLNSCSAPQSSEAVQQVVLAKLKEQSTDVEHSLALVAFSVTKELSTIIERHQAMDLDKQADMFHTVAELASYTQSTPVKTGDGEMTVLSHLTITQLLNEHARREENKRRVDVAFDKHSHYTEFMVQLMSAGMDYTNALHHWVHRDD